MKKFPDVKIPRGTSCGGCHFNNKGANYWECCVFDQVTEEGKPDECRKAMPHGGMLELTPKVKKARP
jgi:hypothetical protein